MKTDSDWHLIAGEDFSAPVPYDYPEEPRSERPLMRLSVQGAVGRAIDDNSCFDPIPNDKDNTCPDPCPCEGGMDEGTQANSASFGNDPNGSMPCSSSLELNGAGEEAAPAAALMQAMSQGGDAVTSHTADTVIVPSEPWYNHPSEWLLEYRQSEHKILIRKPSGFVMTFLEVSGSSRANAYYRSVQLLGSTAYEEAQDENCLWEECKEHMCNLLNLTFTAYVL